LYNPNDVAELAGAIATLRSNPRLAARLGAAARREVVERHTWDQRRDTILRLIRNSTAVPAASAN
jgi:glycosyltransferase involved in cell wall biosynthesis